MRTEPIVRVVLIVMGVFTAVPLLVVIDPGQLAFYGVTEPEPMVLTLLQHRGVLQLVAGAALVWAALRPEVRVPVALGVITTKVSALLLTLMRPEAQATASTGIQLFDAGCVVVLVGLVVAGARRRIRRAPERAAA